MLSVVFLVFTLRAILFKPFMKQMNSSLRMQELQPQMKKIREKYKDDRQRQSEELMKLNKEAGVNPVAGCLPALIQAPVFLGLFHVLRAFKPGWGRGLLLRRQRCAVLRRCEAVRRRARCRPSSRCPKRSSIELDGDRSTVIAVAIPLMILAGIATHMTSRKSIARQSAAAAAAPQTAIMNKVMLYLFPLGVVAGGPFFPLAILIYWLSNNTWTFFQLFVAHRIQDRQKARGGRRSSRRSGSGEVHQAQAGREAARPEAPGGQPGAAGQGRIPTQRTEAAPSAGAATTVTR